MFPKLLGWWDGTDPSTMFTTSGGAVNVAVDTDPIGRWEDKSGNGRHWTQATAGLRPTYSTNSIKGRSAVSFPGQGGAGVSQGWLSGSIPSATPLTWTFVMIMNSASAGFNRTLLAGDNSSMSFHFNVGEQRVNILRDSATDLGFGTATYPFDEPCIVSCKSDGSVGSCLIGKNGLENGLPSLSSLSTFSNNTTVLGDYGVHDVGENYHGKVVMAFAHGYRFSADDDRAFAAWLNKSLGAFR